MSAIRHVNESIVSGWRRQGTGAGGFWALDMVVCQLVGSFHKLKDFISASRSGAG